MLKCTHKDKNGNWTIEMEDNRCDTDRGEMGAINCFCTQCNEDITEEVEVSEEDGVLGYWKSTSGSWINYQKRRLLP